jgi:hypothetical protein
MAGLRKRNTAAAELRLPYGGSAVEVGYPEMGVWGAGPEPWNLEREAPAEELDGVPRSELAT